MRVFVITCSTNRRCISNRELSCIWLHTDNVTSAQKWSLQGQRLFEIGDAHWPSLYLNETLNDTFAIKREETRQHVP